jgi:hypothetical protein
MKLVIDSSWDGIAVGQYYLYAGGPAARSVEVGPNGWERDTSRYAKVSLSLEPKDGIRVLVTKGESQ